MKICSIYERVIYWVFPVSLIKIFDGPGVI